MTHRRAWPPRAARRLAANLVSGRRLPWLPLWFAWRRARMMHAKAGVPGAAANPPGGAPSFTISLSYRFDWPRPARAAQAVPARGGAGPVAYVIQPGARPAFATRHRCAPMPMVTRLLTQFLEPDRAVGAASNTVLPCTGLDSRFRRSVASFAVERVAARSDVRSRGHRWLPRMREPLHGRSPASPGQSGNPKPAAAGIAAAASPYQPIQLRPARPAAARANDLAGGVPPLVSSRAVVRPAPSRREVPPNSPSPRLCVALDWRLPAAETAVGSSAGRSRPGASAIEASAASAPRHAPAATTPAAVRALEPAVTERLVQDVIRRVDRRLRIERERRGL
jgi:hypothetical protein